MSAQLAGHCHSSLELAGARRRVSITPLPLSPLSPPLFPAGSSWAPFVCSCSSCLSAGQEELPARRMAARRVVQVQGPLTWAQQLGRNWPLELRHFHRRAAAAQRACHRHCLALHYNVFLAVQAPSCASVSRSRPDSRPDPSARTGPDETGPLWLCSCSSA